MNLGTWVGVINGFIYDLAKERLGGLVAGRLSALLGAILIGCGYIGMWLAATHRIHVSYAIVGIFGFLMGQGSGFTYANPVAALLHYTQPIFFSTCVCALTPCCWVALFVS